MAGKALDSGKAFIDGVLAKLPESLRESAKAAFTAPEAQDALTLIGDGVLARADYSRSMDEITQKETALADDYAKLTQYYDARKADFDIVDGLRKSGKWNEKGPVGLEGAPPKPGEVPPVDASKFVARDEFTEIMRKEQMAAAGFLALQQNLGLKHFQDFGEVLDSNELLQDQNLGKQKADGSIYGLKDAYYTKFKDKITERSTKLETDRISKLVDAGIAERMKGQSLPIPLKNGAGSPLDLLEGNAEFKPDPNLAQTAAEEYARLTSLRSA
jgi:hypothetical protein